MSVNGVLAFRTSKLEVQCDEPLAWTLDGEYGGAPRCADIQIQNKAVRYVTRMGRRS